MLALLGVAGCWMPATAQIPEQYPTPLIHTATNHPADHVLIVSIEGLRAVNLANFVASHPESTLGELSRRGVTFTNAHVPWPDSAAGLMAIVTGGSPISTGIFSGEGYDRALARSGCAPSATELNLKARSAEVRTASAGCGVEAVHQLVRVNSMFDLVHAAGGRTAWADANAAHADLLRGPSGSGLDEVFVAKASAAEASDKECVDAVIGWMGHDVAKTPRLFGLSLGGLDAAERSVPLVRSAVVGNVAGVKRSPMEHVDAEVGRIIAGLEERGDVRFHVGDCDVDAWSAGGYGESAGSGC